jgi:hypothetical protein
LFLDLKWSKLWSLKEAWATSKCHREVIINFFLIWNIIFMDSPVITQLFRQLFRHPTCQSLRSHSTLPFRIQYARRTQKRCMSSQRGDGSEASSRSESNWQQRTDVFPLDKSEEFNKYPMVTADQLKGRRERPRRVKMLTRDFIEGLQKQIGFLDQD